MIGNEFWKYTIFLSSKDRDELENNFELEGNNDINYDQKDSSREYEIDDFSGSGFGEYELIDNNNLKKKENDNKIIDINTDDMKLHIKVDNENNNAKKLNSKKNHIFQRSITDNTKSLQKKEEETTTQVIDKNNYMTNIPTK